MVKVTDYAIIQRDENNEAKVYFSGKVPFDAPEDHALYGRVFTEEELLEVCPIEKCKEENGEWYIEFTIPAGGLYTFEVKMRTPETLDVYDGPRIAIVQHFGVGDLYIMTGQSNMAGYGRDTAYDPPVRGVHLYKNNGKWDIASHPLNDSIGTIYPENREFTSYSSPALSFARYLKEKLNVPIGLVAASQGGSPLKDWHPEENGRLYRGMMQRIPVVGKVKGIIWYQGCFEAAFPDEDPNTYYGRFKRMIELYRKELGDIKVITVQLNRWADANSDTRMKGAFDPVTIDRRWGMVRDAQRRIAEDMNGVYVIPTLDLPLSDGVHNCSSSNVIIGQRMALSALKFIYGLNGEYAPAPRKVTYTDETHAVVWFDECFRMFTLGARGDGMHIEDENGIIPCKAAYGDMNNSIRVETERPFTLPAKFHGYWRANLPSLIAKDRIGQPMLSCYGMEIEKE